MTWEQDFSDCVELLSELLLDDDSLDDAIHAIWACNDKDEMMEIYHEYERRTFQEYDIEEE